MPNMRDASKTNYSLTSFYPTESEIKVGAIQRIADATELMAKNFTDLQRAHDYEKGRADRNYEESRALYRRIYALKGAITKLKKGKKNAK